MKCPKCESEELVAHRIGDIDVDQCEVCGGVWFDLGELDDTLEIGTTGDLKPVDSPNFERDRQEAQCPKCGGAGKMIPVKNVRHGFHIDTCTVCSGKWLDSGELAMLEDKGLLSKVGDLIRGFHGS